MYYRSRAFAWIDWRRISNYLEKSRKNGRWACSDTRNISSSYDTTTSEQCSSRKPWRIVMVGYCNTSYWQIYTGNYIQIFKFSIRATALLWLFSVTCTAEVDLDLIMSLLNTRITDQENWYRVKQTVNVIISIKRVWRESLPKLVCLATDCLHVIRNVEWEW